MEEKRVETMDISMKWAERGSGLPVVMIHGIPTCSRLWRRVMERLDGVRAMAWEMVGYGASMQEGMDRDISIARQADYLAAWMEDLRLEQAVLVGHDLGGGVAQILAIQRPELCSGLVLVDSISYDSWPIPAVRAMRSLSPVMRRLPDRVTERMVRALVTWGHDDRRIARESFDQHWHHYRAGGGSAALLRQMQALDTRDTEAIAAEIPSLRGLPAAVVWGADDPFQKVHYGQRLAEDLGVELTRIAGAKHFIPEDHPDDIAAAIHSVVADVRARARPYAMGRGNGEHRPAPPPASA